MPLLLPAAHLLWRRATYGEWLPNTYFAKHVAPWPEMGVPYAAAFVLEYGYVVWIGVAALAALRVRPRLDFRAIVVTGVVLHFLYYTLDVGGDHFEFRVYQPLVALLALSFAPLCAALGWSRRRAFVVMLTGWLLGLPIPWTHFALTNGATHYKQAESFVFPIAGHLPPPLSWMARPWDALQRHTIRHFVGIRHAGHRTYLAHQVERFPTRGEGIAIGTQADLPILAHSSVGYPAWTMPNVYILDKLGLNDRVIARTPKTSVWRQMAHDRDPPPGYVACFRPNVERTDDGMRVRTRQNPLTAAGVRACEAKFAR